MYRDRLNIVDFTRTLTEAYLRDVAGDITPLGGPVPVDHERKVYRRRRLLFPYVRARFVDDSSLSERTRDQEKKCDWVTTTCYYLEAVRPAGFAAFLSLELAARFEKPETLCNRHCLAVCVPQSIMVPMIEENRLIGWIDACYI